MEKPPGDDKAFRPRIGGRGGRSRFERAPHFAPSVLAAAGARYAALAGMGRARPARPHVTRGVAHVHQPRADARRCIVKARIVRMGANGMKPARLGERDDIIKRMHRALGDTANSANLRVIDARSGVGAELRAAIEARERFLAELGISREPRERRLRALEDLERSDLTRKLAAEHRVTPLPTPLPGMRGRLLTCGHNAAGVPMAS